MTSPLETLLNYDPNNSFSQELGTLGSSTLSDWYGVRPHGIEMDALPSVEELIEKYKDKTPLLIKILNGKSGDYYMLCAPPGGTALVLEDKISAYIAFNYLDKVEFSKDLKPIALPLEVFKKLLSSKQKMLSVETMMSNLDIDSYNQIFETLYEHNIKLQPDVSNLLFSGYLDCYGSQQTKENVSVSALFFYFSNSLDVDGHDHFYKFGINASVMKNESALSYFLNKEEKFGLFCNYVLKSNDVNLEILPQLSRVYFCSGYVDKNNLEMILKDQDWSRCALMLTALDELMLSNIADDKMELYEKFGGEEGYDNFIFESLNKYVLDRNNLSDGKSVSELINLLNASPSGAVKTEIGNFVQELMNNPESSSQIKEQVYGAFIERYSPSNILQDYEVAMLKYMLQNSIKMSARSFLFSSNISECLQSISMCPDKLFGLKAKRFLNAVPNLNNDFERSAEAFKNISVDLHNSFILFMEKVIKNDELAKRYSNIDTAVLKNSADDARMDLISQKYNDHKSYFHNMIFVGESKDIIENVSSAKREEVKFKVVYNNDKYLDTKYPKYTKGEPLLLNNKAPIGYNIHLPDYERPIQQIVVEVYGGFEKKNREKYAFRPGAIGAFEQELINEGIAVITLNLNDLLELDRFQEKMPENIHTKLHASINHFFEVLKNRPTDLHQDLSLLKDANVYLYGASFGGRTSLRQGELYPETFKGYISHDGAIVTKKGYDVDLSITQRSFDSATQDASVWLDPSSQEHLQKLHEPVLILQNKDDNNVNEKVAFKFLFDAIKQGRGDLIRLHVTHSGNPIPSKEDKQNKGHFIPTKVNEFDQYCKAVLNFIKKGPDSLPSISIWKGYENRKLANKYYKLAKPEQRFVAEALQFFLDNKHQLKDIKDPKVWDKCYQPILESTCAVEELLNSKDLLNEELNRLKNNQFLTDEVLSRVLASNQSALVEFLKDVEGIEISDPNKMIVENPYLIKRLRESFYNIDASNQINIGMARSVLTSLYTTSPNILLELTQKQKKEPQYKIKAEVFKKKFRDVLEKRSVLIKDTWKQAIIEVKKEADVKEKMLTWGQKKVRTLKVDKDKEVPAKPKKPKRNK